MYNVYNTNTSKTVPAWGNYWNADLDEDHCFGSDNGCWPFTYGLVNDSMKFSQNPYCWYLGKVAPTAEAPSRGLPTSGALNNFPNPFNSATTIEFSLSRSGPVEVVIYNVLGEKVRTLWKDDWGVGQHQIIWNGEDDRGNTVASGVYFYRIVSRDGQTSRKMVVLK